MPEYTVHPGDIMVKFSAFEDFVVRVPKSLIDRVTDRVEQERQAKTDRRELNRRIYCLSCRKKPNCINLLEKI